MSTTAESPGERGDARRRAARRARLARIFGESLPQVSAQERGRDAARNGSVDDDARLRKDVPPHYGLQG